MEYVHVPFFSILFSDTLISDTNFTCFSALTLYFIVLKSSSLLLNFLFLALQLLLIFHLLFQTASSRPGCRSSYTCCPQERSSSGADLHSTLRTQWRAMQRPEGQSVTEQRRGLEERWRGRNLEWRMFLDGWG